MACPATHVTRAGTKTSTDGKWIFFPTLQSSGNDIQKEPGPCGVDNFLAQRKYAEETLPGGTCVAFTTNGWYKNKIQPRELWIHCGTSSDVGMWVKRRALDALEWQFFPGMDSEGNDIEIADEFAGSSSHLRYYVNMAHADTCVAFNTNGRLKRAILPKEEWTPIGGTKYQGLWVKKSALEALDWVFFQGLDIDLHDISQVSTTSAEELKQAAVELREKCVAYNTNGWLKHTLIPRAKWTKLNTNDAHTGIWVKKSELDRLDWELASGMESAGDDIEHSEVNAGNTAALFGHVANVPSGVAFNTNGWIKNALRPHDEWTRWSKSPYQGLWIKRDQKEMQAWQETHPTGVVV